MKKSDLLKEIAELRKKLDLSRDWMKRQVHESKRILEHDRIKRETRGKFQNELESAQIDIFEKAITDYFGQTLDHAPPRTLERLLDSEIQWYMLQRFPRIDAVGLAVTYQKIVDSLIDISIVRPFREYMKKKMVSIPQFPTALERDILRINERKYQLSFGRLYEMILAFRSVETNTFLAQFKKFLSKYNSQFYDFMSSESALKYFEIILDMEVFTSKRHIQKVSYSEAQRLRTIMVGSLRDKDSLLRMWFET